MKGNKTPLYALLVFLLVFSIFIWLITRPSALDVGIKDLEAVNSIAAVKTKWETNSELQNKAKYVDAVRAQVLSLNPSSKDLDEVKAWLPPATNNLNIIIVPDLSVRTHMDQNQRDTALINQIWRSFVKTTRLKKNSKDRLLIDVTDNCQPATVNFSKIADSLVFDLSKQKKGQVNKTYFKNKNHQFSSNVAALYSDKLGKVPVADYVYYFQQRLKSRIKKSNLTDQYRNVVFILTDGYLETNNCGHKNVIDITPSENQLNQLCNSNNGISFNMPRATSSLTFPETEVYVLEVDERPSAQGCHERILRQWWKQWFETMGVSNIDSEDFFSARDNSIQLTKEKIEQILNPK